MKPFRCLLVDNDNTLMDFNKAEHYALLKTLQAFGLPADKDVEAYYCKVNQGLWQALERGETTQALLKVERFRLLLEELGRKDVFAVDLTEHYEEELSRCAYLLPGAREFVEQVSAVMPIALVSNGVSRIQRGRLALSPITRYFSAVVISEEAGVSKPDPTMISLALEALGIEGTEGVVFLGDSLTADIACARAAGVESIWLAPPKGESALATHVVHSLAGAKRILLRGQGEGQKTRA